MTSFATFQLRGAAVIALGYGVFVALMTDGLTLGQRSAETMTTVVGGVFVVLGIMFALLWAWQMRQDGKRTLADEREEQIEATSERAGYRLLDGAIFVLLLLALSDAKWGWLGSFALTRPEGLVFALVTASASAGIGRFIAGYLATQQR